MPFRHIDIIDDLSVYFPFANALTTHGFCPGDRFLNVGGGHDPSPQIAAAIVGGISLGLNLGGGETASAKKLTQLTLRGNVGKAITEAKGSVDTTQEDFLEYPVPAGSIKALLMANVINQPSNFYAVDIAEKAITSLNHGEILLLTDSHFTTERTLDKLKSAIDRTHIRLKEINDSFPIASQGLSPGQVFAYRKQ